MRLFNERRSRVRGDPRSSRLRIVVGAALAAWMVGRPVQLTSVRWWRVPTVVTSIHLTGSQIEAIDRIYQQRLAGRRRCIERLVAASNRVDQFMRDGVYDAAVLEQTQAIASAAADQRTITRLLNDQIVAVLSPDQRVGLATMRRTIE